MNMLDGFEIIDNVKGVPSMSMGKNGIAFSKAAIEKLHRCEFVQLMIDKERKMVAIVPCEKESRGARSFYNPKLDISKGARWNNYDLRMTIETLMGWNFKECGWKSAGLYSEDYDALIFHLDEAKPIKREND